MGKTFKRDKYEEDDDYPIQQKMKYIRRKGKQKEILDNEERIEDSVYHRERKFERTVRPQ